MVRYKKRYFLAFTTPMVANKDKIQHLIQVKCMQLFGVHQTENIRFIKVIYFHPITGTLIVRCRLHFMDHMRVALMYFSTCHVVHCSATIRQLLQAFETKMRHQMLTTHDRIEWHKHAKIVLERVNELRD